MTIDEERISSGGVANRLTVVSKEQDKNEMDLRHR